MSKAKAHKEGDVFGHLTVIGYDLSTGRYLCRCACGNTTKAGATSLSTGKHKSCGCSQYRIRPEKRSIKPGEKFGYLTVVGFKDSGWECLCVCGNTTLAEASRLKDGSRKGCGCRISTSQRPHTQLPDQLAFKRKIFRVYERQAVKRGFKFELSFEDLCSYLPKNCHYCDSPPSNVMVFKSRTKRSIREFSYNGIDRIDNTLGYTLKNTVTCCKICNTSKANLSKREWLAWVEKVYKTNFRRDT